MVEIKLKDGEDGYEKVAKVIKGWWDAVGLAAVVVAMETSYDGNTWYQHNEVAYPDGEDVTFIYDWWEGEKYIRILGIKDVNKIDIR